MDKIWIAVIAVFVCIIGLLGTYYESPEELAGDILLDADVTYTDAEMQELYEKYNITENDLKFARGEFPHYLEGTVFHGNLSVLVTETGEPPEGSNFVSV